ncbi:MAG: VanZ family protein [Bacteroidales bacterium]
MLISKFRKPASVLFWTWLACLLFLTFWPGISQPEKGEDSFFSPDYFFHFGAYFLLTGLFLLWKFSPGFYGNSRAIILSLSTLFALAVFTEFIQKAIPERAYNPFDMLCNALGIVTGFIVWYFPLNRLMKTEKKNRENP